MWSRRRIEEVYWRLREAVVRHHQRGGFTERSLISHICLLFRLLREPGGHGRRRPKDGRLDPL